MKKIFRIALATMMIALPLTTQHSLAAALPPPAQCDECGNPKHKIIEFVRN